MSLSAILISATFAYAQVGRGSIRCDWCRSSPLALRGCGGGEVLVDEADDRRALPDRGCAAIDRAGADVACGEDAGGACCEQAFGAGFGAGEDESLGIARDHVAEPVGAGGGAEEEEEGRERQAFAVGEGDGLEVPLLAVQGFDF